jgi:hypothetical protein
MRSGSDYALSIANRFAVSQIGKRRTMIHPTVLSRDQDRRNWPARASVSLVGVSWLALFLRVEFGHIFSIESPLDWFYVVTVATAPLAGLAGLIAIKWRRQPVLAIGAFLLSLALPTIYTIVFWPTGDSGTD